MGFWGFGVTRDRKFLQEEELEIQHQLDFAFRDVSYFYRRIDDAYNRMAAAVTDVKVFQALVDGQKMAPAEDAILRAYLRLSDAQDSYYRSIATYEIAIEQLHWRIGSLLEYDGVFLAEGPWPAKAYFDARRRAGPWMRRRTSTTGSPNRRWSAAGRSRRTSVRPKCRWTWARWSPAAKWCRADRTPNWSRRPAPTMDESPVPTAQPIPSADQARARSGRQQPAAAGLSDTRNPTRASLSETRSPAGVVPAVATSSPRTNSTPAAEGVVGLVGSAGADQNRKSGRNGYDLGSLNLTGLNEPIATSPSAAPDQSAPGWKAAQH